jgi:hypothetical protein
MKYRVEKDIWVSVDHGANHATNAYLIQRGTILELDRLNPSSPTFVAQMPGPVHHPNVYFDVTMVQNNKEWFSLWEPDPPKMEVKQPEVWINVYHGSKKERVAILSAGYHILPGEINAAPFRADPFEVARKIHAVGGVYVAVGLPNAGDGSVVVFVSDDCFDNWIVIP